MAVIVTLYWVYCSSLPVSLDLILSLQGTFLPVVSEVSFTYLLIDLSLSTFLTTIESDVRLMEAVSNETFSDKVVVLPAVSFTE